MESRLEGGRIWGHCVEVGGRGMGSRRYCSVRGLHGGRKGAMGVEGGRI